MYWCECLFLLSVLPVEQNACACCESFGLCGLGECAACPADSADLVDEICVTDMLVMQPHCVFLKLHILGTEQVRRVQTRVNLTLEG